MSRATLVVLALVALANVPSDVCGMTCVSKGNCKYFALLGVCSKCSDYASLCSMCCQACNGASGTCSSPNSCTCTCGDSKNKKSTLENFLEQIQAHEDSQLAQANQGAGYAAASGPCAPTNCATAFESNGATIAQYCSDAEQVCKQCCTLLEKKTTYSYSATGNSKGGPSCTCGPALQLNQLLALLQSGN